MTTVSAASAVDVALLWLVLLPAGMPVLTPLQCTVEHVGQSLCTYVRGADDGKSCVLGTYEQGAAQRIEH